MLIRSVLFNFQGASSATRSGDLFIISHLFELVKYFFKISFEFSLIFSHFRRDIRGFAYRFRSSLFIISLWSRFVKYFLKYFSDFFESRITVIFISAPLPRQLLYYTLFFCVCQHIYWKILHNKFYHFSTVLYISIYRNSHKNRSRPQAGSLTIKMYQPFSLSSEMIFTKLSTSLKSL